MSLLTQDIPKMLNAWPLFLFVLKNAISKYIVLICLGTYQ